VIFAGEGDAACRHGRARAKICSSPEGDVDPEVYLPAFVRRYPFVFAMEPGGERRVHDRAAPMIGEAPDVSFVAISCRNSPRMRSSSASFERLR
jgi:hypothetical protein